MPGDAGRKAFFLSRASFGQYGPVAAFELYLYPQSTRALDQGESNHGKLSARGRHRFATASAAMLAERRSPKKKSLIFLRGQWWLDE